MSPVLTARDSILAHLNQGRPKAALKEARVAMKKFPKEAGFANLAAIALNRLGQQTEAVRHFALAAKMAPGDPVYEVNVVQAMVQAGMYDKARALIDRLLTRHTDPAPLLYQAAMLGLQEGDIDAARAAADRAVAADEAALAANPGDARRLRPALARSHNLRAVIRMAAGLLAEACADYEASLALVPDNAETLSNYAQPLSMMLRTDEALAALEKALTLQPRSLMALERYAIQLNEAGRTDEARDIYDIALQIDPAHADLLRAAARIATPGRIAALRGQIDAAWPKVQRGSLDQVRLAFGRGHLAEAEGDRDAMLHWYETANRLACAQRPWPTADRRAEEEAILARFPVGHAAPEGDTARPRPIFVLGQPRSGTTLTELVLSAHPALVGMGEQNAAGRLADPYLSGDLPFDADAARAYASGYRAAVPQAPDGSLGMIDKMPANYRYVGFILTAMPDAVIIDTLRDPRDVAWSMWRNWFPNAPMNYTFEMTAMAEEANAYRRFMRHWAAAFPGRIHEMPYEVLVRDIEGGSRRLAEWCGVDWVPDMAAPERNTAAVRTASVNQVRQGVHTKSIGGWRAQGALFDAFNAALDPDLWPGLDLQS